MLEITAIEKFNKVQHYRVLYFSNTHNEFINFLHDCGFDENEIMKVDTPFFELEGGYIFLKHKLIKIHLFFEEDVFHMVIDSSLNTKQLSDKLKKHFIFPDEGR